MAKTSPRSKAADPAKPTTASFENSLGELERLVERLEGGEQSLEDALKDFERGILLTRQCQEALKQAELRVQRLVQRDGEERLDDLEAGDGES
ncbi:MAG TPA: exodeoxyribonuclease VII small subunit [Gammaproteobacteria bacterium]